MKALHTALRFIMVACVATLVSIGFFSVFYVQKQGLEQLQLEQCLTRPWLDTKPPC